LTPVIAIQKKGVGYIYIYIYGNVTMKFFA
jgi:hypothetical protein